MCLTNFPPFEFNKMHFPKLRAAGFTATVTKQEEEGLEIRDHSPAARQSAAATDRALEANGSFIVLISTRSVVNGGLVKSLSLSKVCRVCKCICSENSSLISPFDDVCNSCTAKR